MRLRSFPGLVLVLLLASAAPPPRVTNALIASSHRQDSAQSKKPCQSRARNRIGFPILVDAFRPPASIVEGRPRKWPSWMIEHRAGTWVAPITSQLTTTFYAHLRLRC